MTGMLLDGKSAVIMGSGSGVGRASALRFAEEGAKAVVADVDLDRAKETVRLVAQDGDDVRRQPQPPRICPNRSNPCPCCTRS